VSREKRRRRGGKIQARTQPCVNLFARHLSFALPDLEYCTIPVPLLLYYRSLLQCKIRRSLARARSRSSISFLGQKNIFRSCVHPDSFVTNGYFGLIIECSSTSLLPAPIFNSLQSLSMVVRVTAFPCQHLLAAPFLQLSVVLSTAGDWGPISHYSGAIDCPPRLSYSPVLVPTSS
jgi:hypothetical protein